MTLNKKQEGTSHYSVQLKISEGYHNMPAQNISLWHMDYFVLKAIENQQMQENYKNRAQFSFYKGNLHL